VTMAEYVAEILGKKPKMRLEPSRIGEVTQYIANIGKARAILGYNPSYPLRDGLQRAVAWSLDWWSRKG
jgi:UDP-glucuronate 4-epimerase